LKQSLVKKAKFMVKLGESFGKVAKEYQRYRSVYNLKTYKLLASLLGAKNKKYKILDVGCGTGKSTEPLVKIFKNAEIIGCDPDKAMLAEARANAKKLKLPISYIEGRAEKLPFADDYFDAVIAGTALHWFGTKKAVKEIKRVLKPGGIFFVFWRLYKKNGPINWGAIKLKYKLTSPAERFKNNQKDLRDLFIGQGFKRFHIASVPFVEHSTATEEIGKIKTYSSYLLLPAKIRPRFIAEVAEAYEKAQINKKFIINSREIFIGYGFKK
jgi:ubiquinone/menaquinone biosynthesis C-methylase UbiE